MTERRIKRAVILAAGMGSRLNTHGASLPKPLRDVGGVPLIVRVLRTLQDVGIQEAVIVVGHEGDRVRRALTTEPSLGLKLQFVDNPNYRASNGVSLLAAAPYIDEECLLSMSDHLYSPELPRRLMSADLPEDACGLGVDFDIDRCFDIDDATKVQTWQGRITAIGKELPAYDAIDTGVFRIGPALVAQMQALVRERGDCSLSDGVRALAEIGRFFACDIGDARWIDVDTPPAVERAEAMVRVFGDALGDEPAIASVGMDPDAIEQFAPTWVRAARPYKEDHFAIADNRGDVLRMMSNESPFGPSPRVVQAIVEAATHGNLYPTSGRKVRSQLAAREALDESNVLLGAGSTELIDVIIRTFVAAGEEVLISVPTFSMYEARTRVAGGIPVLVPLDDGNQPAVPALIRGVTERTKVLFLCSPNNPTGQCIRQEDLVRIARLGLPTVVDEAYWELSGRPSYAHLIREFPNLIVLRTFSKAFGLAGMRLGYAFAHGSVVQLLSRVKVPWNVPAVTLAAASAALEDATEFAARMTELRTARDALSERLSRFPQLSVLPSEGNFVLIDISSTGFTGAEFVDRVLEEGVLIRSLETHHATRHFVRVTVGTPEQNQRCVAAIEAALALVVPISGRPVPRYASAASDAE